MDQPTMDGKTAERSVRKPPFGAPHVYILALIDGAQGPDASAIHRIEQRETVIGRGAEADFQIGDDQISKQHCMIRVEGPLCTVKDLQSLNGTLVNGRQLLPGVAERLRHLDEVQLGSTRLLLLTGRFRSRPTRAASQEPAKSRVN